MARLLVRRLVEPLTLWDETAPEWDVSEEQLAWLNDGNGVPWETTPKPTALLDGLVDPNLLMASPICASWNQLGQWLRAVDGLRRGA